MSRAFSRRCGCQFPHVRCQMDWRRPCFPLATRQVDGRPIAAHAPAEQSSQRQGGCACGLFSASDAALAALLFVCALPRRTTSATPERQEEVKFSLGWCNGLKISTKDRTHHRFQISSSDRTHARGRTREDHSRREQHEVQPASDPPSRIPSEETLRWLPGQRSTP